MKTKNVRPTKGQDKADTAPIPGVSKSKKSLDELAKEAVQLHRKGKTIKLS